MLKAAEVILDWQKRNRLSYRNKSLLLEAYRRFYMFAKPDRNDISEAWLGLGYQTEYNSIYFKPYSINKGSLCWFMLTKEGKNVLSDLIVYLPWKESYSLSIFKGEL
jgi:hypothetical protein